MENIGILHLSDIHANISSIEKIDHLLNTLLNDLNDLKQEYNTKIQAVCISGDLIDSGDNADTELNLVFYHLIAPLMEELHIAEDAIFVVPGNHEVKRSKIVNYIENGLESTLKSEESIDVFIKDPDSKALERINYFDDFSSLFHKNYACKSALTKAFILECDGVSLGIACINSSWRSTGIGMAEKGKLVVGQYQIIESLKAISSADIKICLMHHPIDWLVDADKMSLQKCLNGFDLVLNGHIHEPWTETLITYNGKTVFNTCGKFDDSKDSYNGYSLISINPYNKECHIILRQYYAYPRNRYDKAIGLNENGVFRTNLKVKNKELALAFEITQSIKNNFLGYANSYFVSNVAAGKNIQSFDEAFITPVFSSYSEYEKETQFEIEENRELSLEEICSTNQNILILGKKEIGKTTLLHYILNKYLSSFDKMQRVPFLVDCNLVDYSGKNVIVRYITNFVNNYCQNEDSYSQNDIISLLENGSCVILFDNFDKVDNNKLEKINNFISLYSKNKFIFSETESVYTRSTQSLPTTPICSFEKAYMCSLTKSQIRIIAKKTLSNVASIDNSSLVDKIMLCFKKTSLPKTPFVLSLLLTLCVNSDFSPINESTVMERFMEFLLEKSSENEVKTGTYDYKNKEDFLIFLVTFMNSNNKYNISKRDFENLVYTYHLERGFVVSDTHFDKIFFDCGILIKTESFITFRYSCMIEYYLAKKAITDPQFLNHILSNKEYLNYQKELMYYTGLCRWDTKVIETIDADLSQSFEKYFPLIDKLNDYHLETSFELSNDNFKENLSSSRLSQTQSDKITDSSDNSETFLPENIDKSISFTEKEEMVKGIFIFGECIKNLESLTKTAKKNFFNKYLFGLSILLVLLKEYAENMFEGIISELKENDENNIEAIQSKAIIFQDFIKIALPLSIQNMALENVGTIKLRAIFEDLIKENDLSDFSRFICIFMFSDLRIEGLSNILSNYIKKMNDKSWLTIIFFKLMYYYRYRYFGSNLDPFLESTLADINIKINKQNKYGKDYLIQDIKKSKNPPIDNKS